MVNIDMDTYSLILFKWWITSLHLYVYSLNILFGLTLIEYHLETEVHHVSLPQFPINIGINMGFLHIIQMHKYILICLLVNKEPILFTLMKELQSPNYSSSLWFNHWSCRWLCLSNRYILICILHDII